MSFQNQYTASFVTGLAHQTSGHHQAQMIPLQDQQQFESEIWTSSAPANKTFIIYFTAPWCGACKRLDLTTLTSLTVHMSNVSWYKCDIDENDYTAGFCQIRQIPTFLCIRNKQVISRITSSVNETVANWLSENLRG